jgi:hypothetical protein
MGRSIIEGLKNAYLLNKKPKLEIRTTILQLQDLIGNKEIEEILDNL